MSETIGRIIESDYPAELRNAYLDYAMSTIVSRALPDVRDGLKPVHRRIVYVMKQNGFLPSSTYKKSARTVADVMGKYHPHGDGAIYDAMVRMAQWWSLRYPLVDGQGNFGSLDRDPAAAMRYTEARMAPLAADLVGDIDKKVVKFQPNYDGQESEPTVLPAAFPNILVNGVLGIAVGMATNMPTHNLREVVAATLLFLEKDDVSLAEIMEVLPGPDFPTRGVIIGRAGIKQAYETGRGSLVMSGVARVEEGKSGKSQIIISEIPFGVVKSVLQERIAELAEDAKEKTKGKSEISADLAVLCGIQDVRDESNRKDPVRLVIDVRKDSDPHIIINALRKLTEFQTTFGYNATCLDSKGKPSEMSVATMLREFVTFRREVVRNRVQFDLDSARGDQSRQIARYAAVSAIDEVVRIIRNSADVDEARAKLLNMEFPVDDDLRRILTEADPDTAVGQTLRLIEEQANVILAMTLRQLTGLEREKIVEEALKIAATIRELIEILITPGRIDQIIRNELEAIAAKRGDERRTVIEQNEGDLLEMEDLIERKDIIVTLTASGYVKRTDLSAYKAQGRGGKGRNGMTTKEDDVVVSTTVCHTKSRILVFTENGRVYALKAFQLKDAGINGNGRPIQNYVEFADGEKVASIVAMPDDDGREDLTMIFVTENGTIRRNAISDFTSINRSGKMAMRLDDGTSLVGVFVAAADEDVIIGTRNGLSVRFPVDSLRIFQSRDSLGVRAVSLKSGDKANSAAIIPHSDATTIEREVYLAGGVKRMQGADLKDENGNSKVLPDTLTVREVPDAERPDGVELSLSGQAMEEMRSKEVMLLTVSANGFGKRSSSHEFRCSNRGGSGMAPAVINDRTGELIALFPVEENDDLVLMTDGGQTIRTRVREISVIGRVSRGVRVFRLEGTQKIVSVSRIAASSDADDQDIVETNVIASGDLSEQGE